MGSLRVRHNWVTSLSLSTFMHWRRKWQPTPMFLPGEFHGRRSLVGCSPWGRTELDTTEATWQQQQTGGSPCLSGAQAVSENHKISHPHSHCLNSLTRKPTSWLSPGGPPADPPSHAEYFCWQETHSLLVCTTHSRTMLTAKKRLCFLFYTFKTGKWRKCFAKPKTVLLFYKPQRRFEE